MKIEVVGYKDYNDIRHTVHAVVCYDCGSQGPVALSESEAKGVYGYGYKARGKSESGAGDAGVENVSGTKPKSGGNRKNVEHGGKKEPPRICINCRWCTKTTPVCLRGHDPKWRDCEGLQDHSWGFQGCTKFKDI